MTENHDLAPAPDVDEQWRPVVEDSERGEFTDGTGAGDGPGSPEVSVPLDADPADVADQAAPVDFDDDYR
ncbi:hypothetical protein GCM10009676_30700 [Prauserella halophila]|uniref:Uncharacterized protein n=1 Tax=Prauserella halophila TaxID=185641 RepID=A0ABN1WD05_9PSEU|nr:hypothetical protein [Prauserella halophila]MCP2234697.1 hypothetical protein [Prauserella halophila]